MKRFFAMMVAAAALMIGSSAAFAQMMMKDDPMVGGGDRDVSRTKTIVANGRWNSARIHDPGCFAVKAADHRIIFHHHLRESG